MAVIHSENAFMEKLNKFCQKVSLSDENFEALSKQAERELKENHSLYMFKVMALALVGYAFMLLVCALLLLGLILMIKFIIFSHQLYGFKLIILFLIPLWFIAKSFWIKIPEPTGIVTTRNDSPELFDLLDELSAKLHTRVDKVLLDDQYNAAVIQIPRLGLLGFYKNIVMIGLPLMLTLRPEQFKAILAHELGHLSGNHSKSSAWIYHVRGSWAKLLRTMDEANSLFFAVFLIFFSWFSPRFSAYSLALARAHELEADANAAEIAGVENFTASMLSLPVYGKFLGKVFWPGVKELIKTSSTAPDDVFVRLQDQTATYVPDQQDLELTIKEALEEKSSGGDTHPPLRVRLFEGYFTPAIGQVKKSSGLLEGLAMPITTKDSAAYNYLGRNLGLTLIQLSTSWQQNITEGWTHEHNLFQAAVENLNELKKKEAQSGLTIEELKLKAYLVGETQSEEACVAVYNDILAASPEEAGIRFSLGLLMIKDDIDEGLKHLETAMSARSTLLPQACPTVLPLLKIKGRHKEAAVLESRLEAYYKDAELAQKERHSVNGESILEPHGLKDDDLSYLQEVFSQIPSIREAYVVRKFVRYLPDCPYLVVGLEMKAISKGAAGVQENIAVAQWLIGNLQLRYEFCVSTFDMHTAKLKRNIIAMDDSLVYRK
jgi:Zn-dependent protease with chaperone function